jgi:hypothetical protein
VGPRAVLDAVVKRKVSIPLRESNPRTLNIHPVDWSLHRLSYHGSYPTNKNVKTKYLSVCFKIIILHVLYGCGTWSLLPKEKQRWRVLRTGS